MLSSKILRTAPTWPRAVPHQSRTITTAELSSRENQTMTLPDGRLLGWASYGAPEGEPLLFFHGFPTSRVEVSTADSLARRHGINLIALDRPGFGLSSFQPGRRIIDWPADVRAFASHVGLDRFAVLGGSGGGPFALACAHSLPPEMMSAVGVMSGAGPWEAGMREDFPLTAYAMAGAAVYCPGAFVMASDALVGMLRWAVTTGPVVRRIDAWLDGLEPEKESERPVEQQAPEEGKMTKEERRERLLRICFDGFAQGSKGFVQETRLLSQNWEFRFEDIPFEGVKLFHGTLDKNAPIRTARYIAERVPSSILREFEGDDHYSMGNRAEEIMLEVLGKNKATERKEI